MGIREVLPLKVGSERTRVGVSQRCECVCVCVCVCVLQGDEENKHKHREVEKFPVPSHCRVLSRKAIWSEALFRKLPLTTVARRDEREASGRLLHSVT